MESVLPEPEGRGLEPSSAGLPPIQPLVVAGTSQLLGLQKQLSGFECSLHDFPLSASVSGPCFEDTSLWVRVTSMFRVLNFIMSAKPGFPNKVRLTGAGGRALWETHG